MRIAPEVLRDLDPRKSYDRGAWTGIRDGLGPDGAVGTPRHRIPMNLSSLSTKELRLELERRANALVQMKARRDRLSQELAALDTEIAALEGTFGGGGAGGARKPARLIGPKPRNSLTLPDAVAAAVEAGKVVSPTEVADLVLKGGYLTTAKNFRQAVTIALSRHAGFKRVDRGRYERIG